MADTARQHFERRLSALKSERSDWVDHWRDLSSSILPRRGRWLTTDRNKGDRRNKLIDNTPTLAARTLASGMMAGITSPARPWFKLTTPDPEMADFGPVKEWLGAVEGAMRKVFAKSNLYNVLPVAYEELGVFGTGPIAALEDFEDAVRFQQFTAGEYCIANSERGTVDTLYREVSLTVSQAVGMFVRRPDGSMDWSRVSNTIKNLWDKGSYDEWCEFGHAVEPNPDRVDGLEDARGMPVRSVYWEKGARDGVLARVSGFRQFPFMCPRWHIMGQDVYGRSPGMDCLGDAKALQVMQREKAKAIQKMVTPPLVGGSSLRGAAVSLIPGDVTYVDGAEPVKQLAPIYQVNPQIQHLVADIEDTRRRIDKAFFADLFLMISQLERGQITAYEVQVRQEEKLLMLGPVLERVHDELLEPLIDRVFSILLERGMLPPPPQELQGVPLGVEMVSMLAQAQRAIATGAIERLSGFIGNLAAANPGILDVYDMDTAARTYGAALGVDAKILRPDDKVEAIRQSRAQQEQQAQAMQQAQMAAQGAETLSRTDTRSDNALTRILGLTG